jgi:ABC-type enterobactin transport system permease subunit
MQARNLTRIAAVTFLTSLAAGVVVATTMLSPARTPSSLPVAQVQTPMVGVATGEMQNGVPVYRLPSVTVAVSRSAELARMAREEQIAAK